MAAATSNKPNSARDKFLDSITKSYGKGALTVAADVTRLPAISTGSLSLDHAMGSGGYMIGRITEIWGPPSGGKTTEALIALGNAQRTYPNKIVGLLDVEATFDKEWAIKLGVDTDRLDVFSPPTAEDVADIMKEMLQSEQYSMIVLDSIGAMLPEEEFEKDAGGVSVGTIAKIITRMVKISAVYAKRYEVAVVVINQVRANIGYGADTTTGGGWALKHVTTHKLQIKRASSAYTIGSDQNKVNVGYKMGVKVEKNKVAPEGRNVQFDFYTQETEKYGPIGINESQDVVAIGLRTGVIQQAGAFYTIPGGERIKSRELLEETVSKDSKLLAAIREGVMATVKDLVDDELPLPDLTVEDETPFVDTRRSSQ